MNQYSKLYDNCGDPPAVILLSANDKETLYAMANQLANELENKKYLDSQLADLAYTLQIGREQLRHRFGMIVTCIKDLVDNLRHFIQNDEKCLNFECSFWTKGKNEMEEDSYSTLLRGWVYSGEIVDWKKLYPKSELSPRVISLPTYPFLKEKYWVPEYALHADIGHNSVTGEDVPPSSDKRKICTFGGSWKPMKHVPDIHMGRNEKYIFLLDDEKAAVFITEHLRNTNCEALPIFIFRDEIFRKVDDRRYFLNPQDGECMKTCLEEISEQFLTVTNVICMWSYDGAEKWNSYDYIFNIIQACSEISAVKLHLIWLYQTEAERAIGESWIGFERSIKMAMPDMKILTCLIKANCLNYETCNTIVNEINAGEHQAVVYEDGVKKEFVIENIELSDSDTPGAIHLRKKGVYLITGGLGGLGFELAKWLAKSYEARLALVNRSVLDRKKIDQINELVDLGAEVSYQQANVCELKQMEQVVQKVTVELGQINGVIHAAGIMGMGKISNNDLTQFKRVMESKVQGTLTLVEALQDQELDFLCLFSSNSAIIGDFGSCDYAVGNRFLLSFATAINGSVNHHFKNVNTICWPLWRSTGMGFESEDADQMYLKTSGQRYLEVHEGLQLFKNIIEHQEQQVIVMAGENDRMLNLLQPQYVIRNESPKEVITAKPVVNADSQMIEELIQLVSKILRISKEKIDIRENLADFGFDSITLAELTREISKRFEIGLTPDIFFTYATVEKVSAFLLKQYPEIVEKYYADMRQAEGSSAVNLDDQANRSSEKRQEEDQEIAIIAMSGVFPAAKNVEELWTILKDGKTVTEPVPSERQDWWLGYSGDRGTVRMGTVPGIGEFDPLFFEITPLEAETMDPKQRILLQESWKALENAGYGQQSLKNEKIGMFVGVEDGDYGDLCGEDKNIASNHNGVLAARLSYFMDLKGPNMAINTACSSGLVALHEACQSIKNGECDSAIVAGVSLMVTSEPYLSMKQSGMLSESGISRAFDDEADGMIPAEAVGVIVIKPLNAALRDGNPIAATIVGSAINYDGKTNGLTAPSGEAQKNLLLDLYERIGMSPKDISYIVAHGTATRLGDPIELNAMIDVFNSYFVEANHCALTSTKSNIGHSLAASGIVSLISLLLALKHKCIPASVNYQSPNKYVHWDKSPIYVNTSNKEWVDSIGELRVGAVNAFGMSGTNAHIVIKSFNEELYPHRGADNIKRPSYLVALSAKTEDALRNRILDLRFFMEEQLRNGKESLASLSCSLLDCRFHFRYRAAFLVSSYEEFMEITKDRNPEKSSSDVCYGMMKRNFVEDIQEVEKINELLLVVSQEDILNEQDYQNSIHRLAEFYCKGYAISGAALYPKRHFRRMILPNYPFDNQTYWISSERVDHNSTQRGEHTLDSYIHPLLQSNISTFEGQRFLSAFDNSCFFLADHIVRGENILPGVAYLEMARKAIEESLQVPLRDNEYICLKNIGWFRPISATHTAVEVTTTLIPQGEDIHFEISTNSITGEKDIHVQGAGYIVQIGEPEFINIVDIKSICPVHLSTTEIYESFSKMGIDYGPGHKSLTNIWIGNEYVIGRLSLPKFLRDEAMRYVLHPSMMDGALQAPFGFAQNASSSPVIGLPFAIQELDVWGGCDAEMWVIVTKTDTDNNISLYDIKLCNMDGEVAISIGGYASRAMKESNHKSTAESETHLSASEWVVFDQPEEILWDKAFIINYSHHQLPPEFQSDKEGSVTVCTRSLTMVDDECFKAEAIELFNKIKSLLLDKNSDRSLIQVVVDSGGEGQLLRGVNGLLKSASQENPKVITQLIELDDLSSIDTCLQASLLIPYNHIRFQADCPYRLDWHQLTVLKGIETSLWKPDGVYLITGGSGALGMMFAREIIAKQPQCHVVLSGRSLVAEEKNAALTKLLAENEHITYRCCDISNRQQADDLVEGVMAEYGSVNGILHCAGLVRDSFIIKKTTDEVQEVLAPKVSGVINLDLSMSTQPLDFFITFSSTSGAIGNAGQADYAMANTFMDSYIRYREELRSKGKRAGRSISIAWPFWVAGGMKVAEENIKELIEKEGIYPIDNLKGLEAFYAIMDSQYEYVVCMEERAGMNYLCHQHNYKLPVKKMDNPTAPVTEHINGIPSVNIAGILKSCMADVLKIPIEAMEDDAPFDSYGIDSIQVMKVTNELESVFGTLPKTLFYEYQTITELADYLNRIRPAEEMEELKNSNEGNKVKKNDLTKVAETYIQEQVVSILKLPASAIDGDTPFESLGIDSISVMKLTNHLEDIFGTLPKTLFYEYQTIEELTGYFMDNHKEELIIQLGTDLEATEDIDDDATKIKRHHNRYEGRSIPVRTQPKEEFRNIEKPVGLKGESRSGNRYEDEDIAVIGLSGIYPKARSMKAFWNNLVQGTDCVTEIPGDRWDYRQFFSEEKTSDGRNYCKWGGFIDGVDAFDPLFFNISPRDAESMDPQERLFLECVYEAIEDAGYTPAELRVPYSGEKENHVGVYVGVLYNEYQFYGIEEQLKGRPVAVSGSAGSLANRVSYYFNFHGPSISLDTMCSSALTSIHLACESIRSGECDLAFAGGANLTLHMNKYLMLAKGKFSSSRGRCESFGKEGDGYVPGEGVGTVLLKPLSKAVADGDNIYGIIKGSAINHGGRTNGYTVPNPKAQTNVIEAALQRSQVSSETINYVETHGTGTALGDPIEVAALTKVFVKGDIVGQHCSIGSVKSNIGHCESAAGIAGLTKVLLQMKYRKLVPSLHSKELNPYIDFEKTPFVVQQKYEDWKPLKNEAGKLLPLRAGLSSFGAGGSNAHVIIEEYSHIKTHKGIQKGCIIPLSAKTKEQLLQKIVQLRQYIVDEELTDTELMSLAYTLQTGRESMEYRYGYIVRGMEELINELSRPVDEEKISYINKNSTYTGTLNNDEDIVTAIDRWFEKEKHEKILEFWKSGVNINWRKSYGDTYPNKISLPTYPFACESYWITDRTMDTSASFGGIHPYIKENISNIYGQKFALYSEALISGTDNVNGINGDSLFKLSCIEAVRAAAAIYLDTDSSMFMIGNISFSDISPDTEANIYLYLDYVSEDSTDWQICKMDGSEEIVICSGSICTDIENNLQYCDPVEIGKGMKCIISERECLPLIDEIREDYREEDHLYRLLCRLASEPRKPAFRYESIIHRDIVNKCISLRQIQNTFDWDDILSMVDSAYIYSTDQVKWILYEVQNDEKMQICFFNDVNHCIAELAVKQLEKDLIFDEEKNKVLTGRNAESKQDLVGPYYFKESWKKAMMPDPGICDLGKLVIILDQPNHQHDILHCLNGHYKKLKFVFMSESFSQKSQGMQYQSESDSCLQNLNHLDAEMDGIDSIIYWFSFDRNNYEQAYKDLVLILQETGKLRSNPKQILTCIPFDDILTRSYGESMIGFERSLKLVMPKTAFRVLLYDQETEIYDDIFLKELSNTTGASSLYLNNERHVCKKQVLHISTSATPSLKEGGTYIITGGTGGLGRIFAEWISKMYQANIVLVGRSSITLDKQKLIEDIENKGGKIICFTGDVCKLDDMQRLAEMIAERFEHADGIIHAAGLENNINIFQTSAAEFTRIIYPKTTGAIVINQAFADTGLDFICYFSSTSAVLGDFGSCNYSVANRFLMAYGDCQQHITKTILWPLWKSEGMGFVNDDSLSMYLKSSGQELMEASVGTGIFEKIIESDETQAIVFMGDKKKIDRFLKIPDIVDNEAERRQKCG